MQATIGKLTECAAWRAATSLATRPPAFHHALALQPQPPTPFAESLAGLTDRVTFHNEDTGFAVLKAKGWFTLALAKAKTDGERERIKLRAQGDPDLEPFRSSLKEL